MTREQLIQAIYDNSEEWSCHDCIHLMEEENPRNVCWKCAEKLLKEYENKIRADVIDELVRIAESEYPKNYMNEFELGGHKCHFSLRWLWDLAEKLKEQK